MIEFEFTDHVRARLNALVDAYFATPEPTYVTEAYARLLVSEADRSADRVRFAAIALASAAVVFLLAIIAGGMT